MLELSKFVHAFILGGREREIKRKREKDQGTLKPFDIYGERKKNERKSDTMNPIDIYEEKKEGSEKEEK